MVQLGATLDIDRCPHCSVHRPNMNTKVETRTSPSDSPHTRYWKVYACQTCGGCLLAYSNSQNGLVEKVYPGLVTVNSHIPERARTYLLQAIESLNSPAGSVMLSASSVDAMLKAKGYRDGSLYSRIDKAADDHVITPEMAEWAHEVRLDANEQRHSDEEAPLPRRRNARRSIEFALALGEFMFVLPARVQRGLLPDSSEGDDYGGLTPAQLAGM